MADYPGVRILNTAISIGNLKTASCLVGNGGVSQGVSRSFVKLIPTSIVASGLSKLIGKAIYNNFRDYPATNKAYFNNAFYQDSSNIYLNKSALGLPANLNLSLEALFVALLIQWANNIGLGSEAKIQAEWLSYGDLDDSYLYFTIQITFRKAVTVVDDYEIQLIYSISPLDF
ncbi:hypothetical protein I8748_16500 [Nostoc sp. CENA67]|uniref:Uncharacterized protein n=1 Tax=Amazonocrinis nigriterrae CENA67 TaxID=2794033 RepID=A0A8J7HQH7_9NOST|nr:hypothetical protein [Amazonocrinis nigriterrae]MBH8563772.1 hypothetical protein [Amazonocrinis nigriterrae CENA67]